MPQLSRATLRPGELVPEGEGGQASRQRAEAEAAAPAITQSMAMSGGRGNGREGKSGAAKLCTGWVQQNGRVRASRPVCFSFAIVS